MSQGRAEPPRRHREPAGSAAQGPRAENDPSTPAAGEAPASETPALEANADGRAPGAAAPADVGAPGTARPRRRRRGRRQRPAAGQHPEAPDPTGAPPPPAEQGAQPAAETAGRNRPPRKSNRGGKGAATSGGAAKAGGVAKAGAAKGGGAAKAGAGKAGGAAKSGGAARKQKRTWMRRVDEFSAGGLVLDMAGDVPRGALIGRTDKLGRLLWSLPKGHIEEGETAEQAAVREVQEETGISGEIVADLGTIDFWFVAEGRRIHKTVRHFLMRAVGGELSDADIEVTEVAWVPLPEFGGQLAYPDERGLVETAGRLLAESA